MDMVYNPTAIQRISDFFNSRTNNRGLSSRGSELQLTRAARLRYEELKTQTKQELRQTLDGILEGEQVSLFRSQLLLKSSILVEKSYL